MVVHIGHIEQAALRIESQSSWTAEQFFVTIVVFASNSSEKDSVEVVDL